MTQYKLEQVVIDALMARGMSENEAKISIQKIKNSGQFKGDADLELSDDGQLVAISDATVIAIGPKSYRVSFGSNSMWVPRSQVHATSEIDRDNAKYGDHGILVISRWIAGEKGFTFNGSAVQAPPSTY